MKRALALVCLTATLAGCLEFSPGEGAGEASGLTLGRDALVFNAGGSVPSDARSVTLTNPGAAPVSVSAAIVGADAAHFSLGDTASFRLEAGESRELTVTFTPAVGGADLGPHEAPPRAAQHKTV
jgi:hypothetical protein